MIFRLINVAFALIVSYIVFYNSYEEFYSYLPTYDKLKAINTEERITQVLRENSMGLRDLYNHAFEQSMLYAFVTFIISMLVFEYIRAGNLLVNIFKGMKDDVKVIRRQHPSEHEDV